MLDSNVANLYHYETLLKENYQTLIKNLRSIETSEV